MRQSDKKQIGKWTYEVRQLTDPEGMRLLVRLMRILTPTLGAGLKGLPESGQSVGLADLTTGAIGEALIEFAAQVSEEDMEYICDTLAKETHITGPQNPRTPLTGDPDHWSGRYSEKFLWLIFALEVNYADFLGGKDSIARVAGMMQSVQRSRSPSSSSGDASASSPASTTPLAGGR